MMDVLEKIRKSKIIPVVVIENVEDAKPLAEALFTVGLHCVEITFRTKAALEAIRIIKEAYPEMTVGAGTVLQTEQVCQAQKAGAEFIVSPGSNEKVIRFCMADGICIIPGVMTPSEIEKNLEAGLGVMKFFPAQQAGGIEFLKALHAPYPMVRFMPTGGITPENIREYLKNDFIIACGGSWIVPKNLLEEKNFQEIHRLAEQAVKIAEEFQ